MITIKISQNLPIFPRQVYLRPVSPYKFITVECNDIAIQLGSSSQEALEKDTEVMKFLKEVHKFENNVDALLDLKAGLK